MRPDIYNEQLKEISVPNNKIENSTTWEFSSRSASMSFKTASDAPCVSNKPENGAI